MIGFFHGGTQRAGSVPTLQRAEFDGTMDEFFEHFFVIA